MWFGGERSRFRTLRHLYQPSTVLQVEGVPGKQEEYNIYQLWNGSKFVVVETERLVATLFKPFMQTAGFVCKAVYGGAVNVA